MLGAAGLAGRFITSWIVLILSAYCSHRDDVVHTGLADSDNRVGSTSAVPVYERRQHVVGEIARRDAEPRRTLPVDIDLDGRKVQHLRDARIDHARHLLDGAGEWRCADGIGAHGILESWIWISIGADRPKLSILLTMSAVWK